MNLLMCRAVPNVLARDEREYAMSEILERHTLTRMPAAIGQMESNFLPTTVTHLKVLDTAQVSKCPSVQLSKCSTI